MEFKDYYTTLGVSRGSSDKEIKQAYRRLARQHHPDVNPQDKNAEARFREINEAYAVLSDPEKRKRYDDLGANWDKVQQGGWTQPPGNANFHYSTRSPGKGFEDFFEDGFSDFFQNFFGGSGFSEVRAEGEEAFPQQTYEIQVTLEEAYQGTVKTFRLPLASICLRCGGKGIIRRSFCPECRGQRKIITEKRVEVRIPKGIREGQTLRLRLDRQEIRLNVKFFPHLLFKVQPNGDLSCEVSVPFLSCILGGELEISTLKGKTVMKVPPGTQNGATLRLKELGMPSSNGRTADLFVSLRVVLPTFVNPEEKRLYQELKRLHS